MPLGAGEVVATAKAVAVGDVGVALDPALVPAVTAYALNAVTSNPARSTNAAWTSRVLSGARAW